MPESPGYLLKVLGQDGAAVRRFPLPPGEHLVGSDPACGVRLDEPGISRRHARLTVLADGGATIVDLGSKNGTFVGERRIREVAITGFAALAFGATKAFLQPADLTAAAPLLAAPAGQEPGTPALATPSPPAPPSTMGLHPVERLAESLAELLPPLWDGLVTREEAAADLAERWIELLPLGRIELLRARAGGEPVLVAAAGKTDLVPRAATGLEVRGPGGWRLSLRAPSRLAVKSLEPLWRLALTALATGPRRRSAGASTTSFPAALPAAGDEEGRALPPGLGREMARIYRRAAKLAKGDVPVLVLGESGAGKEVLARFVHERSPRRAGPFLAVNCAALPRDLLEAELFGIEKGVATGVEARPGLLERAAGGTVFLDEVGDMAAETQAKVLRVLESTSLYRVGGRAPVSIDVRFVAATNRDLAARVAEESFRRDLYHRLAAAELELPPLRERREEIPALAARFFWRELEKAGGRSPGISRAALGALVRHPWPGNVRELKNELAHAVLLLEPGETLEVHHLSPRLRGEAPARALALEETVIRAEREAFAIATAAAQGDANVAMEILGISRTTYYRKLKELGLGEG